MSHLVSKQGLSWSGRERNRMFLSVGGKQFVDASSVTATDFIGDARALGLVDWNHDGMVDMLLLNRTAPRIRLLRNHSGADRHWLQVDLTGTAPRVNRDAIGARVLLSVGDKVLCRTLYAGDGLMSQSSKTLFFGLGDAGTIDKLTVRWPDGSSEDFGGVAVDQRIHIVQGEQPVTVTPPVPPRLAAAEQQRLETGDLGRVTVISKIPMAEFPLPSFDNPKRKVKDLAGRPLLINFWSTTCASCIEELGSFQAKRGKLKRSGLQIVTMLTEGPGKHEQAKKILDGVGLLDGAGFSTPAVTEALRILSHAVLTDSVDIPLPVSLLLDQEGNLVQIHLGAVRIPNLLRDLGILRDMDPRSPSASALSFGSRVVFRDRDFNGIAKLFADAELPQLAAYYRSFVGRFGMPSGN
jgi:peroxiredoxin